MNFFQQLKGTSLVPVLSDATNARSAQVSGINRFGMSGFLSLELVPAENDRLLRAGYLDNSVVFTVCHWKNQQQAKAPLIVYDIKNTKSFSVYSRLTNLQKKDSYALRQKAIEEIDDPSDNLVKLVRQPNPSQSWSEFAYAEGVYRDFGNSLIYGVEGYKGQFAELYLLPPSLYSGQEPTVEGYRYFVDSTGANARIDGKNVLHIRRFNPKLEADGGGLWGMSKLAPARRLLARSNYSQEAEAEMMQNRGARKIIFPKGYTPEQDLSNVWTAQQGEAIRKRVKQAGSGGLAFNTIELGEIDLGMTADELRWYETNKEVKEDTCALWGVDTIAVFSAVSEASRANADTAVRKSLIDGVLPDQRILADKLNGWLLPRYNAANKYQRYVEHNTDVYPQLQTDKKDIATWMNATILTANQRNEMFGFERSTEPGMDIPLVPPGFTPITDFVAQPADPNNDVTNDGSY